LHGVGVSVVNALSNHLRATVHSDGKIYEQEYEKGKALYPVKQIGETTKRGTIVTFILIQLFYSNYRVFIRYAQHVCVNCHSNKGITITFTDKRELDKDGNLS
jgi:DNA gyrase subunit B